MNYLFSLPKEILIEIFCFLDPLCLIVASRVCKLWKRIIFEHENIWRSIYVSLDCKINNCYCKRFQLNLSTSNEEPHTYMEKVLKREWMKYNHSFWYDTPFPAPSRPIIFIPLQITQDLITGMLPEYNREAFMLPQNASRRRIRSLHKIVKVGNEKLVILADNCANADSSTLLEVTGRHNFLDIEQEYQEMSLAKTADRRLRAVCAKFFYRLDKLYCILWKAIRMNNPALQSVFGILQVIAGQDNEIVLGMEELPPLMYKDLTRSAGGVVRKTFSLYFTNPLGIDGVKQVLKKTQLAFSSLDLIICYESAPYYKASLRSNKQQLAIDGMKQVLQMIKEEAKLLGGNFEVSEDYQFDPS